MTKVFKNAWAHINEPNPALTKSDKIKIGKEIFKESLKSQGSPWAICTASVGRENSDKYEECVMHVKEQLGVDKAMKEEDFGKENTKWDEVYEEVQDDILPNMDRPEQDNKEKTSKDVGLEYAGPTPKSGLAAQDLEVDTPETTKLENETADGTKEKEDASGPLPNRVQLG